MESSGKIVFKGVSGKKYVFTIQDIDDLKDEIPAVYIVTSENQGLSGRKIHTTIYIDQTNNLRELFTFHYKKDYFYQNKANRLCILMEDDENIRLEVINDIKEKNKTLF